MDYERVKRRDEEEMHRIIRTTGPGLTLLLGSISVGTGISAWYTEQKIFAGAAIVSGVLAAVVLTMYSLNSLAVPPRDKKKNVGYNTKV